MPWYGWLLLGAAVLVAVMALTFRLLRASRRGRRFLSLSTRGKLEFGRALLADRNVPMVAKVALGLLVAYLALPFDLIPDFIPVLGQLDDAAVIVATVALLVMVVPRERFEAALDRAEGGDERRRMERAKELPGRE